MATLIIELNNQEDVEELLHKIYKFQSDAIYNTNSTAVHSSRLSAIWEKGYRLKLLSTDTEAQIKRLLQDEWKINFRICEPDDYCF